MFVGKRKAAPLQTAVNTPPKKLSLDHEQPPKTKRQTMFQKPVKYQPPSKTNGATQKLTARNSNLTVGQCKLKKKQSTSPNNSGSKRALQATKSMN